MTALPVLNDASDRSPGRRLPPWLKRPLPAGGGMAATRRIVARSGVATVCEEARCPNLTECWSHRTATFMILGDHCTRRCHFCAVSTARPESPVEEEPQRLAEAVVELGLRHVVITAVARDDLPDEGAGQFARCVREIRSRLPETTIEVLPADFHARPECITTLCDAKPDVYNHNIETVERLSPAVRPQAKYRRSLKVLEMVKQYNPAMPTKSGLMVGLGETVDELKQTMADLHAVGCEILTIGQYLQPSPQHAAIEKFYTPQEFDELAEVARSIGFREVFSGPYVRSSYHAGEVFLRLQST